MVENFKSLLQAARKKLRQYYPCCQSLLDFKNIKKNKPLQYFLAGILALLLALVIFQPRERTYFNKIVGYQVTVPPGWVVEEGPKAKTVILGKGANKKTRKTAIKIDSAFGNPYGSTPLDYLDKGILPRAQYTFEQEQQKSFVLRGRPYTRTAGDREWAVASLFVDSDVLYVVYVTTLGEYTVAFILESDDGIEQGDDERTFYRVVNSMVVKSKPRANVFLDGDVSRLFTE